MSFTTLPLLLVETRCTWKLQSVTLQSDCFAGRTNHGLDAMKSNAVKRECLNALLCTFLSYVSREREWRDVINDLHEQAVHVVRCSTRAKHRDQAWRQKPEMMVINLSMLSV